jgi:inner membrane protein involved in colicin E2 resistance
MVKRISAIGFIFFSATIAWAILGSTIFYRTYSSDSALRGRVASTWGAPQEQEPPTAGYDVVTHKQVTETEDDKKVVRTAEVRTWNPLWLEKSRVDAALHLDYREKGLLWYSTYHVQFSGAYEFLNPDDQPHNVTFMLRFPAREAIYDDLVLSVDGHPLSITNADNQTYGVATVLAHRTALFNVSYRSQGLETWSYNFGNHVAQVKDFQLRVATDFVGFNLPEGTLSPSEKHRTPAGWELAWNYKNLMSGYKIGLAMPQRLQPGLLAGRISYFAPVSLLFFFFVLFFLTTIRGIEFHPMNYFFLACAFFSFHLLMAYLVDHISIHAAFAICSAVSIFLVVSYLRLVVGMRFAAVEAGVAQMLYLVLFSYAFFYEGFTGLAITIGAIITLFVAMQVTGRIRWAEKFATRGACV